MLPPFLDKNLDPAFYIFRLHCVLDLPYKSFALILAAPSALPMLPLQTEEKETGKNKPCLLFYTFQCLFQFLFQ